MATGSHSILSTPMQETGDPSEQLLRKLRSALGKINERLKVLEIQSSRNPTERDRKDIRRLNTFKKNVEKWIAIVRRKQENQLHPTGPSVLGRDDDNESVPDDWEQQIYRPPLRAEMNSRIVAPQKLKPLDILQPDRYPNKLIIDRARVLILTTRNQFGKKENVSMERSAHDYTAVRHSLIEQFGYEDTLEYIIVNTIILEKLQFENVTYERTGQVIRDNGFDREIPDIKHLKSFMETYRQLSSMLATKHFKDKLNRKCQQNDLPDILKDVYWTWGEMQLMLNLLVDDPRNKKDTNALIVFISMHGGLQGGKTIIYDCDGKHFDVNQVLQKFKVPHIQNNDNLCSLLFLSVCRGDRDNESEAVNVFVEGSGNEIFGLNTDQGGSEDIISRCVLNTEGSEVIAEQRVRRDTESEGLENTGRAGLNVDQGGRDTESEGLENTGHSGVKVDHGGSGDTTSEGLENTGRVGVKVYQGGSSDTSKGLENTGHAAVKVDQGGSGDTTSESLENTSHGSVNEDQGGSGNTNSQRLENSGTTGVNVDQGGKEDRTSEGLENKSSAEVIMKQRDRRERTSDGRENTDQTEVNTRNSQLSVAVAESEFQDGFMAVLELESLTQLQVEGSNYWSVSDSINDKQNKKDFSCRSDDNNARIQAESLPVPKIGPVHSSPTEEEVVQKNIVTKHLFPETAGSCPNNCLVAYASTPGFKSGGYEHTGTLYIQKIVNNITQYESVALLPFLTLLHKDLAVHLEMPTFDHRLTKMPVLKKNET